MADRTPPTPPADLPKYLRDGVPKQDAAALEGLRDYIDDLLAFREVDEADLPDDAETVGRDQSGETRGWVIKQKVKCGDETCKCASGRMEDRHGPYRYLCWYDESGDLRKKYVENKPSYWR